jgi:hypothetical protein
LPRAGAATAAPADVALATPDPAATPGGGHDPPPPTVTLAVGFYVNSDSCNGQCLPSSTVVLDAVESSTVQATAVAAAGTQISNVMFQFAPAGTSTWTTFARSASAPYSATFFPASFGLATGHYNVRAVATDNFGDVGYSAPVDVIFVNYGDAYVALESPGSDVTGTIQLEAAPAAPGSFYNVNQRQPDNITFEYSPSGTGQWTTLGTVSQALDANGNPILDPTTNAPLYLISVNTKLLGGDGLYDFETVSVDSQGTVYVDNVVRGVLVDNTGPSVTLATPPSPLTGIVTLNATVVPSISGVAAVRFEVSPAGAGAWSTIGVALSAPYVLTFDTRGLQNGQYDIRAEVSDLAGTVVDSSVAGVTVANPASSFNPDSLAVTDYVVPATGVVLLGAIASSPDNETWAIGFTTAPPALVGGSPLPYTAHQGTEQPVLLRYTDATGWQIADVLWTRNPDGTLSSFQIQALATFTVTGQMAPSGEAWLLLAQTYHPTPGSPAVTTTTALFHRAPGGQFILDPVATATEQPLLSQITSPPTLTLGEAADGSVYGLLVNPGQVKRPESIVSEGAVVTILAQLSYGLLTNGTWTLQTAPTPPGYVPAAFDTVAVTAASLTGPGTGWAALSVQPTTPVVNEPLRLASFDATGWTWVAATGLDALDLTDHFASGPVLHSVAQAIAATSEGVWIQASSGPGEVVALYDPSSGHVIASWCSANVMALSTGCGEPLDGNHPAAVPNAVIETPSGPVAYAEGAGAIDVYAYGIWSAVPVAGFGEDRVLPGLFTGPASGWLSGTYAVGQISAQAPASPLASWPLADENTLTSVALPPAGASTGTSGALAVGLDGAALHYDSSAGWLVDPVPQKAQSINLLGVAFSGQSSAVAVGGFGTILDWNGTSWSEDPASGSLTIAQLNAVAFAPDGEGWAVGTFGTILHFDGTTWSVEQLDAADAGADVTSVTVAGSQVFAVAGGNLVVRGADGTWNSVALVDPSTLPAGAVVSGQLTFQLTLVSGLPDGGIVAAGKSVMIVRQSQSANWEYSDQPIDGIAVALAAFRDPASGEVRAFVSVAPPVNDINGNPTNNVGGFPAGDGELLVETGGGWEDLSRSQYPAMRAPLEGVPEPDPVLAIATSPDGTAAWAVGGYAGTITASGAGDPDPLQARPVGWQTASVWRYDVGGSAQPPALQPAQVIIPGTPGVVSFAFFSSPDCNFECASVAGAQPDVNLSAAMAEIAAFAGQPGGPAFAMLGGNAVGDLSSPTSSSAIVDLENLHNYLTPLGGVPLYGAQGPLDGGLGAAGVSQAWEEAFAQSPAPFGLGGAPAGVTPISWGGTAGSVNLYYSFEVTQNGGTLFVIVLDNAAGSLDASVPGQTAWLQSQLAAAGGLPVIVVASRPLDSELASPSTTAAASDADSVAAMLAAAGVLAVFTTSPTQSDTTHLIPYEQFSTGAPQIPEYEGGSLGYQQVQNDGVMWYDVSVDTVGHAVSVNAIPVVQSLSLEPLDGLTVTQSSTLSFRAVARRPDGTLTNSSYENYVSIPAASCSGCVTPSYAFTSSIPGIGDFVAPTAPGSLFPLLGATGKPKQSSTSGLYCAYNPGTDTVSVTSGLLTASQTVTVLPGEVGQPCGTVFYLPDEHLVTVPGRTVVGKSSAPAPNGAPPPAPAPTTSVNAPLPAIVLPPPPAPAPVPPPTAPASAHPVSPSALPAPPLPASYIAPAAPAALLSSAVLPPLAPPATPIPPGGATAQAAARREERARKHARQSAYVIRPGGVPAVDWFYPAVGLAGVLAMLFLGAALANARRPAEGARLELWDLDNLRHRPRRRF